MAEHLASLAAVEQKAYREVWRLKLANESHPASCLQLRGAGGEPAGRQIIIPGSNADSLRTNG